MVLLKVLKYFIYICVCVCYNNHINTRIITITSRSIPATSTCAPRF